METRTESFGMGLVSWATSGRLHMLVATIKTATALIDEPHV
jgi:hypothetical protein